ncbi:MAG: DUF2779 domain-containing protein [Balneolaceae bacterium]|nr:MAG: DUF2779 domain-containing protein [Balneolaceae bacterium]
MAAIKSPLLINDHFFQQAVSCPLKINFMTGDESLFSEKPIYRQRNKLNLRNAAALRFPGVRHTSDSFRLAARETEVWLRDQQAAICGAVIMSGNLVTRIPILVKDGNRFFIIQIHGKLRKESERSTIDEVGKKRTTAAYLLKSAYRFEVLKRAYPNAEISVEFFFPGTGFRSTIDGLNRVQFYHKKDKKEKLADFNRLFSSVDATPGTLKVCKSIPEVVSHSFFSGQSVGDAADEINSTQLPFYSESFRRHEGCKWCDFRKKKGDEPGCWQSFFLNETITKPDRHIFELAGHGNQIQSRNGIFYQEKAEIDDGLDSFEKMYKYGGPTFTIQQRRNLQILQAKSEESPILWMKPGIKKIDEVKYPLHFIDFEAATYALPFKRAARPYEPVYFQFSCHTLGADGSLCHTWWIDLDPENPDPHPDFVNAISRIPGIFDGTVIQFSPFESQGIKNIINTFKKNSMIFAGQIIILEEIRHGTDSNYRYRFFDINELIRSYYYNSFQMEGLGLKQMYGAIKKWEDTYGDEVKDGNPEHVGYQEIQDYDSDIYDGSTAMNAWIALKNDLLSPEEKRVIPEALQKYCSLDSYAMLYLFRHLQKHAKIMDGNDLVIFSQSLSK